MLSNHPLMISRRFDHTEDFGRRFFRYRQIKLLNRPDKYYYRINAATVGPLAFAYAEYEADLDFDVGEQEDAYFAVIRWGGHDDVQIGTDEFALPANGLALLPPGQPLRVVSRTGARGMAIRFERDRLEKELARLLNQESHQSIPHIPTMPLTGQFARTFHRMARFLAVEINQIDSNLACNPAAAHHAANALTTILLEGHPALSERMTQYAEQSRSDHHIRRVEEYVRGHLDQPMSIGDLAAVAGLSASTLHEQFRRLRQCAPMQFVRKLRLEAVRRDLMSGLPFGSVTEVAYRWGFVHLGRFADHYRRMFGEAPSTTLKKHKR